MTESELTSAANEVSGEVPREPDEPRWMRILKRAVVGVLVTVIFLIVAAASLFQWGGMWIRTPQMKAAYAREVAAGQAPPIGYRFTIPIPGCVCHSDSPDLQAKHSVRHIRDCMKCHDTDPAHEEPGVW